MYKTLPNAKVRKNIVVKAVAVFNFLLWRRTIAVDSSEKAMMALNNKSPAVIKIPKG
jgi:hypothetical protein